MAGQRAIPCKIYRGGTSRGLIFAEEDLPVARELRERFLLRAFGSPDVRQIDGLGGASSQTSKAMLIRRSDDPEVDVVMRFAQVGVGAPVVDWGGNCGNLTAAVGPYAIEAGLVRAFEPVTRVRIRSANTGARVHAAIPVVGGAVAVEGDYEIAGVPSRGARIDLDWLDPGGGVTGSLLPTDRPRESIRTDAGLYEVSIVDAGNPVVFCRASAVGLEGTELPAAIEARPDVMAALEAIRSAAAEMLGIVSSRAIATRNSPGLPKVAVVAPPAGYVTSSGREEPEGSHDLHGRLLSMQTAHRSYAVTGGIATAVAACLSGTVVHDCVRSRAAEDGLVRIGHPYGVMDVRVRMAGSEPPRVVSARIGRTARLLMSGLVHVPESALGFPEAPTTRRSRE